jgi:hypothetical protein
MRQFFDTQIREILPLVNKHLDGVFSKMTESHLVGDLRLVPFRGLLELTLGLDAYRCVWGFRELILCDRKTHTDVPAH